MTRLEDPHMPAYVIVEVDVTDQEKFAQYTPLVPATLAAYGGRFLARGGKAENLEGGWQPKRIVIIEFQDMESAKLWWASAEYHAPKALRQRSAVTDMIVVDGVVVDTTPAGT